MGNRYILCTMTYIIILGSWLQNSSKNISSNHISASLPWSLQVSTDHPPKKNVPPCWVVCEDQRAALKIADKLKNLDPKFQDGVDKAGLDVTGCEWKKAFCVVARDAIFHVFVAATVCVCYFYCVVSVRHQNIV